MNQVAMIVVHGMLASQALMHECELPFVEWEPEHFHIHMMRELLCYYPEIVGEDYSCKDVYRELAPQSYY